MRGYWLRNLLASDYLKDPDVDGRIVFQWVLGLWWGLADIAHNCVQFWALDDEISEFHGVGSLACSASELLPKL
jgi:hypothetical protein